MYDLVYSESASVTAGSLGTHCSQRCNTFAGSNPARAKIFTTVFLTFYRLVLL